MYDNHIPSVRCSICDLGYAPADAGDRRWHATYHARVDKLAVRLGRWPSGYSERERRKAEGDQLLRSGADLAEKLRGAEMVLTALFDREVLLRLQRKRPGRLPDFARFLRTLNPLDLEAHVGKEVALHVHRQYGL
jgi:hypothetical protein